MTQTAIDDAQEQVERAKAALKSAKALAKAQAKAEEKAKAAELKAKFPCIDNWFQRQTYLAPEFETAKFGAPDRKAFSRIRYAFNPADHSTLILVRTGKASWASVVLDNRAPQELARICAQAEPDDPNFRSLYDEIEAKTTGMLNRIFSEYGKSKKDVTQDELVSTLLAYVPHLMLKNYTIGCLASKEEYKPDPEKETVLKVSRPHAAWFCSGDLSSRRDAFDHICENADQMLKHREMCMELPKLYSNDPEEAALHHVDLKSLVDREGKCPTWETYFKRFNEDEARVIRAFIYGIFDARNGSRQMLYIYDKDGFSGKSVLINAIARFLGTGLVASIQKDSLINQFSLSKVYDKRLVAIGDNKNPNLVRSEKMHMMLGGDSADIEKKGRDSFSFRLQMKIIASGNTRLNIDPDATHERTRVIIVTPKITDEILREVALTDKSGNVVRSKYGRPQLIGDPGFEDRLVAEFKAMMAMAEDDYRELCPTRGNYVLPETIMDEVEVCSVDELDMLDDLIRDQFSLGEDFTMKPGDLMTDYNLYVPKEIQEKVTYEDFIAHLAKKHNVCKRTVRMPDGTFPKLYVGIGRKISQPDLMAKPLLPEGM